VNKAIEVFMNVKKFRLVRKEVYGVSYGGVTIPWRIGATKFAEAHAAIFWANFRRHKILIAAANSGGSGVW
jgi:hypothetical protein